VDMKYDPFGSFSYPPILDERTLRRPHE
jgi:hypothetical protein